MMRARSSGIGFFGFGAAIVTKEKRTGSTVSQVWEYSKYWLPNFAQISRQKSLSFLSSSAHKMCGSFKPVHPDE
jgi:hypothetical protein